MAGYIIQSFGCRASAADGAGMAAVLEAEGHAAAPNVREAALVVLNTCAVTEQAERDARAAIRRVRRENPGARIVVMGCYAQRAPGELAAMPGVRMVLGNSHKGRIADAARQALQEPAEPTGAGWLDAQSLTAARVLHTPFFSNTIAGEHMAGEATALPAVGVTGRTRPVLRIQEGCGNRCSFCIIPETRGPSRSLERAAVLAAVRSHVEKGVQELVLSGINLGRWGRDLRPADTLPALVELLLVETGLPRLRLSSIEPMDWDDQMIGLFRGYATGEAPRLAPHAHLPLQSGSDAILRRMHRRYRPWHYAERLAELRRAMPDGALGADVMVGFPGETDTLFQESLAFVERQPFTYLHLFPYSPRPGTAAAAWHGAEPVPPGAVRERMRVLDTLGRAKHQAHLKQAVGRHLSVVTLQQNRGLAANFLPLRLSTPVPANRLLTIHVASIEDSVLVSSAIPDL